MKPLGSILERGIWSEVAELRMWQAATVGRCDGWPIRYSIFISTPGATFSVGLS